MTHTRLEIYTDYYLEYILFTTCSHTIVHMKTAQTPIDFTGLGKTGSITKANILEFGIAENIKRSLSLKRKLTT